MIRSDIIQFANKNPVFFLATTNGEKPFVRALMLLKADEKGIFFSTWQHKDLYRQLLDNPQVELCFYDAQQGRQVRIQGRVERIESADEVKAVLAKFRFLRRQIEKAGREALNIFCLKNGDATTWSINAPFEPKQYFSF